MPIHCHQPGCKATFDKLTDLRKHQWKAHPKLYKNSGKKKVNNLSAQDMIEVIKAERDILNNLIEKLEEVLHYE